MTKSLPDVALAEVLRLNTEYIESPESREYRKLSVKLYGRGERLQAETAAELDALLPSILDRAFKGEL